MTEHRPWFASYPTGVPKTLEPYPDMSVFGMLEASARRHPDEPALAWVGKHISFRRLLREVERCSAFLAQLGVGKGDRVALILYNCPQYPISYYAAARLGAIVVGCNPIYTKREMEHQLRDCDPKVVVVVDLLYSDFVDVFTELGIANVVVTGMHEYMAFPKKQLAPRARFKKIQLAQGKPWPPVPRGAPVGRWSALMRASGPAPVAAQVDVDRDAAGFIYTGGTTGVSKGAMLSHRNIVANALQACAYLELEDGVESVLCPLPFFHSFGMVAMNVAIAVAGKMIPIANPRDLKMMFEQIEHEKPTFFPGVPRLFMSLNDSPVARRLDLSSLKVCVSGGAALPLAVAEKFHQVTGGALLEGYGLTESSPVTHANPLHGERRPGSIGLPVPDTDCKIVDLENPDRDVPHGERGELCVRGPQIMLGYWNRPEETARTIVNGWLHTGDVAVMDEDGYFRIVDRLKEMIIVSGFNVYPNEVEEVLYRHPKVAKAAVIGVPDRKAGEAVKAFIVLQEGEQATASEILAWCADPANGLADYRVPRYIEFRNSLPETMIGKVLRRILVEEERRKAESKASTSAP